MLGKITLRHLHRTALSSWRPVLAHGPGRQDGQVQVYGHALLGMITLSETPNSGSDGAHSENMKDEPGMPALVSVSEIPRLREASRAVAGTT